MTSANHAPAHSEAFHTGELIAQQKTGALEKMAAIGPRMIREVMPDQHRQFFTQLPFIVVGSQDQDGQPWASILIGDPGFVSSPSERQLDVRASLPVSDPLHRNLHQGAALGLLGIELPTRRRNRANGVVGQISDDGFSIGITQSFGNCPKYIQARKPGHIDSYGQRADAALIEQSGNVLTPAMAALIRNADTFFIATAVDAAANRTSGRHGADVSHRGGKRGFVRVDGDSTLTVPDFVGNYFFNTIGNLLTHPRAGLLFADFSNGDLLYLAVSAEVIWDGPEVASYSGAQRLLRFSVTQARHVQAVLPLHWGDAEMSPFLAPMGQWNQDRS